jgi:hypothetical protein
MQMSGTGTISTRKQSDALYFNTPYRSHPPNQTTHRFPRGGLYLKKIGKPMPDEARSIEEIAAARRAKKRAKKEAGKAREADAADSAQADRIGTMNEAVADYAARPLPAR